MPTATITPKYVNQPKPGKKEGSVKLEDGSFYGVPAAMLGQFSPGGTYEVEYSTRQWQGKEFRSITTSKLVGAAPAGGAGSGKYGSQDDATAERIFVAGALNSFIKAGKIEASTEAVTKAVLALRGAWSNTFGKKAESAEHRAQKDAQMDDEIPF